MNDLQRRFREQLIESVNQHFASFELPENTPLLLSGGTDSATVLFALLESGRKPPCYTFQLGERENNDVRSAKRLCQHFKLDWHLVKMPDDEQTLLDDVHELLTIVPPRKTYVQACHPMLWVGPALMADDHRFALGAVCADAMYGSSQQMQRLYRTQGETAFNQLRQENINNVMKGDSTAYMARVLAKWSVEYFDLMAFKGLQDVLRECKFTDLWVGDKKLLPIAAFEDYYAQGKFVRPPRPFQIESGIREWHETLLSHAVNTKKRKEMAALYRDLIGSNAVRE